MASGHFCRPSPRKSGFDFIAASTPGQKDLARQLMEEMTALGLSDVHMSPAEYAGTWS